MWIIEMVAEDDDVGSAEYWRDIKQAGQNKRASNREGSTKLLTEAGLQFESKNGGAHLVVTGPLGTYDFWPGTGKWCVRGSTTYNRGVQKLIARITRERGEGK